MNASKIITYFIVALFIAVFGAQAITTFSSDPTRSFDESFTALNDNLTVESFVVANIPVEADSYSVRVNDVVIVETTDYTVVLATGSFDLVAGASDTGDTVRITYQSIQPFPGMSGTIWNNLPVIIAIGILLVLLGVLGLRRYTGF